MNAQIALGFGDNVDYEIVLNSDVIEAFIIGYGIRDAELTVDAPIASERDLVVSILAFMKSGSGGERFVASSAIVEAFAARFDKKITLGGTSVRAAIAMRRLGHRAALHLVTVNDHVRSLLPPDCPSVCSNEQDTLYPHLIAQYGGGLRISANDISLCTARPNRVIYHNDRDNIVMRLNEEFATLITRAQVLLVSGFNAMQDRQLLEDRLQTVATIMESLPGGALVFCEDAGFYDPSFSRIVYSTLADKITIVSLNEDELQSYVGRPVHMLDVHQVADALADLRDIIHAPMLVVHTMYWALAYGDGAPDYAVALKGGVTMATTRFRYGDNFTRKDYAQIERAKPTGEGAAFAAALEELLPGQMSCVPVAQVEKSHATTVGLGDAFVGGFLPALLN